jgi:hypothetical protein
VIPRSEQVTGEKNSPGVIVAIAHAHNAGVHTDHDILSVSKFVPFGLSTVT